MSEIHAEVGQRCSIAEFTCKNEVQLLDLSSSPYNIELQIWYELLTQPIHSEIKYKYRITQFISEVLSSVNANGIYFKSTQSSGFNVVCFNPAHFELNKYSERLYITTEIKYEYMADPEDDIVKYTKRDDYQQINGCNTHDEDTTENQVDYMKEWIEYRRNNQ